MQGDFGIVLLMSPIRTKNKTSRVKSLEVWYKMREDGKKRKKPPASNVSIGFCANGSVDRWLCYRK